jgi:glycosyltransferase involved in cell wall biosynthesis
MIQKNDKKTILYLITQSEFGGAQRYVFDLAMNLKNEFNIIVAFGGGENEEFTEKLKENNIEYYILKNLKREISPINDFLAIFEIIKLIKKIKPDIIHLNSSKISILGSFAAKICYVLRVPRFAREARRACYVIYTVHGWVFNEPLSKWKKSFYFRAEKFTSLFKDRIICISKLDYEIAKTKLKILEKKLTLIYHGLEPINFLPCDEARQKLLQTFDFRLSTFDLVIGTIANLYKTKGLEYLIEAIKILTTYNSQLTALIIGGGTERKNLEDLISQLNLKSRVFLLGNIKNAAELLPAFDIYANSSVKEGFPYSILEAMSAGLPIVATEVGGIPEMINDGKNGLLVESQNPQALAEKIKILIEDENLRKIFGEETKQKVKDEFEMEKMIKKTREVYINS